MGERPAPCLVFRRRRERNTFGEERPIGLVKIVNAQRHADEPAYQGLALAVAWLDAFETEAGSTEIEPRPR